MEFLSKLEFIPFYVLASIAVISALGMIWNPNLVRAGFTLIACFASIAGLYFMLAADFVAISQILIYAVGIVLVIVFAVMLCSLKENTEAPNTDDESAPELKTRRWLGAVLSVALFAVLVTVIRSQDWWAISHITGAELVRANMTDLRDAYTGQIGRLMLNQFILAFELVSILLLVVLIGVIILSKKTITSKEAA
jgi:NADH:ubiquinone oxidoreductase subunit 6 (subunit J)